MALPLVSIILPVWNPLPAWLKIAIDSAFQESGCRTEIVLVDDGSNEQPSNWLPSHKDKRIRLIRTPHQGPGHARNVGLENCQGDFVRFLDSDDMILPESTSKLLSLIDREESAVAYGATIVCDRDLMPQGIIQSKLCGSIHLQTALGRFNVTIPAMLIPHKIISQVGRFDERLFVQGDWDYVLRTSEVAEIRGTQNPVYLYRRHQESLTGSGTKNREAIKSTVLIIKAYLRRHPEFIGTRKERLVRAYAQFLISKFQNPEYPLRNLRFWKAAATDPVRGAMIASTRTVALFTRMMKNLVGS